MIQQTKKHDVVMLSMSNYWEWTEMGLANRNLHILNQLRNREDIGKILHIDYLPYTLKRAGLSYLRNISPKRDNTLKKTLTSRLTQIDDNFYRYSTVDSFFTSEDKTATKINDIIKELDFKNTIVWSYLPMHLDVFSNIKSDLKVFDAVDNWAEHPGYQNIKNRILENYKKIDKSADIVFTVAKDLVKLFPENNNVNWIPNGVDVEHFGNKFEDKNLELRDLAKGRKIVGYVGIIQDRFDVELMDHVINDNQDKYFVFAGMVWPGAGVDILKRYSNVSFIGHKRYQDLPSYISQFDIAIIPHKVDEFTKSMNPLKVYEYLAAGKPVVSTDVAGVGEFGDLVHVAKTEEDFSKSLDEGLQQDSPEKIKERVDISRKHSWQARVDQMFNLINDYEPNK